MEIIYRIANEGDIDGCVALKRSVVDALNEEGLHIWDNSTYPNDGLIIDDIRGGRARILVLGSEILAYASIEEADEEFGEGCFPYAGLHCFSRLMVDRKHIGLGLGRKMVSLLEGEMIQKGSKGFGILVHGINRKAMSFYESLGYVYAGPKMFRFGEFYRFYRLF